MNAAWMRRLAREVEPRILARFAWGLGWNAARGMRAFQSRRRRGEVFPAFLFLSITSRCNLRCIGCWSTAGGAARELDLATLDGVVAQAKRHGCRTIGLLGGEPLLHAGLLDLMGRHGDCYFVLFTNGTLVDRGLAAALGRLGNVTPLVSIEGGAAESDVRRGGSGVFERTLEGLRCFSEAGLVTGVASSLCRSNVGELASESFVDALITRGVHYLWLYLYRPVGAVPAPDLCLDREQVLAVRRFLVEMRRRKPLLLVDSCWDAEGRALCPAAAGIACHVGPGGDLEPCPPVQLAGENVRDGALYELVTRSRSLRAFRELAGSTAQGCLLMEQPQALARAMAEAGARDSSGRGRVFEELAAMTPRASHDLAADAIPEPPGAYRFAKRRFLFGLGAYG